MFKRWGSACLCAAVLATATTAAATPEHNEPVPILMYHVIGDAPAHAAYPELFVRPRDFVDQMAWLAHHGYHGVTLHRVYEHWTKGEALPPHPIVISFDDGYRSDDTRARPVLWRLHWPGVLNLQVDSLNAEDALPPWRVRNLIFAGWEIDAHTITHPDLTTLDDAQLWREVHGSRVELEQRFHVPIDFFCYPAGRYDAHVIEFVRRAGFLGATTTRFGLARPPHLYELSRVRVEASDGVPVFAKKIQDLTR